MKKNLITAVLMTIATTILLGIVYPLVVTGIAQLIFPKKANGQLIQKDGKTVGSSIIGQGFSGPAYFHSRPSAAGNGYDAANSGGSNFGPTNQKLIDRVKGDVASAEAENPGTPVPIDLVTTSASGSGRVRSPSTPRPATWSSSTRSSSTTYRAWNRRRATRCALCSRIRTSRACGEALDL